MIEAVFEFERETKNTVRLQEVETDEAPVVGTLYLQKHAYKKLGSPKRLKVRIEAAMNKSRARWAVREAGRPSRCFVTGGGASGGWSPAGA